MKSEVDLTMSVCPSVRLSVCPSVRLTVCPSVRLTFDRCFPDNPDLIAARLFYIYVTYSLPFRPIEIQIDRSTSG